MTNDACADWRDARIMYALASIFMIYISMPHILRIVCHGSRRSTYADNEGEMSISAYSIDRSKCVIAGYFTMCAMYIATCMYPCDMDVRHPVHVLYTIPTRVCMWIAIGEWRMTRDTENYVLVDAVILVLVYLVESRPEWIEHITWNETTASELVSTSSTSEWMNVCRDTGVLGMSLLTIYLSVFMYRQRNSRRQQIEQHPVDHWDNEDAIRIAILCGVASNYLRLACVVISPACYATKMQQKEQLFMHIFVDVLTVTALRCLSSAHHDVY